MRCRNDLSIPAIFLLMFFCLWLRKNKMIVLLICIIIVVAALVYYMLKNTDIKIAKNKEKEQGKMERINQQKVYEFLTQIPAGKVVTYGMIAEYLGDKKLARSVGNILHKNPDGVKYPCYKVVSFKGNLSKSYTFGGIEKQKELLIKDNIEVKGYKVDLGTYKWNL